MIMRRKRKISIYIALAAALVLLATETFAGNYGKKQSDIVDTAVSAGTFKTLAAALEAGDLVETLKADGPYTVFVPTDEAFAKLPDGTLEMLLLPENKDKLVAILIGVFRTTLWTIRQITHILCSSLYFANCS